LESILEKENCKERRERVAYVLTQKLVFKFGSKYSNMITFFVDEYMNTHEEISSNDIAALENEIRIAVKSSADNLKSTTETKQNEGKSSDSRNSSRVQETTQNSPDAVAPSTNGNEWQMIQVYQSIRDEEKIKREKELAHQKKMNFRSALDRQREQSKNQNSAELDDERRYVEHIVNDIEKYHADEQAKRSNIWKKDRDELMIRKAQIEETQKRIADEKEDLRRIEIRNLQLADQAMKEDAEAVMRKRQLEKEKMERIKKENEENKRMRQIEKEREAREDFRLMQEYSAKLDREAKERDEAFANRMKTMEIHGLKFANEGAGKAIRDEQIRFEQQLLREQQRKTEDDKRKELLKAEERRRNLQAQMDENKRQLEQRRIEMENEKKRDSELAQYYRQETDAFNKGEQDKLQNYRRRQEEYRHRLDQQSQDWKRRSNNLDDITLTEKQINHEIFDDLTTPQMMSKVLHRVRMDTGCAKTPK
jgi:hypothetical protein